MPSVPPCTGRPVGPPRRPDPLAVHGAPAELSALVGQRVVEIRRRGEVPADRPRARPDSRNPMLTGRFQLRRRRRAPLRDGGHVRLRPTDGATARRGQMDTSHGVATRRRRAGRRSATRPDPDGQDLSGSRPASSVPCPGSAAPNRARRRRPGADPRGLAGPVRKHPGELKNLLRNQAFVAGIGNAYSDENLHAAHLLPFRKRSSLAAEEVDALYAATRSTLADAIEVLRERVPPTFEKQVRDFLAVHDKGGQACPRCGTRITEVRAGGFITSYCRGCQH